MDETVYRVWWDLHLRMAKGETLSAVELSDYNAGLLLLDAEDATTMRQAAGLESLRNMRRRALYKSDYSTPATADPEHRVLHPLNDTLSDHYTVNGDGLLESRTPCDAFHIFLLRLNRPQLTQHRRRQRARIQMETAFSLIVSLVEQQEHTNAELKQVVSALRLLLGNSASTPEE